MATLIIVKPNTISETDKKKLEKSKFVIIETDNPNEVRVVNELTDLTADIVTVSALKALDYGNDSTARVNFGNLIRQALLAKTTKP